jgi:DNA-binding cell septation regulator SpoVG
MKITEVQIEFIKPKEGLIGFASLVMEGEVFLSGIGIHKKLSCEGYRLTYPNKGEFAIFHPITKEASSQIEEAIFKKLKEVKLKVCQENINGI